MEERTTGGLSAAEARRRLEQTGSNELAHRPPPTAAGLFFSQFKDLMTIILAAATVLSALLGHVTDAVTILAIVLLNALMGFLQEYRTEKTMEALAALSSPVARVFRDGTLQRLPAAELVPGDLVSLTAGDRIPADGVCVQPSAVTADESLLTGESVPQSKNTGDKLYMGACLTGGRCRMTVTATGMSTEMGKIAGMLDSEKEKRTPLQERLDDLGRVIAIGCILVCLAVSVIGWLEGEDPMTMLLTGVSLSVAAIPEGLSAIVTIVLALSVNRVLKKGAVIRRMHAVETLGCAGVICTDKTGTVTQNRMTVRRLWWPGGHAKVTGDGLSAAGRLEFLNGGQVLPQRDTMLQRMLQAAVLCNDGELSRQGKRFQLTGDPTETALLAAAAKAGVTKESLAASRVGEQPFDSARKRMSVTVRRRGEPDRLLCKGAPDRLLACCDRIASPAGERLLTAADRSAVNTAIAEMEKDALRVLAFADGTGREENHLVFLGLAGMIDPPRPEVGPAVESCRRAGIRPVMITGDSKATAAAVASQVGILRPGDEVVAGDELERISDDELARRCGKISVFARVSPAHKLRIVRAYQNAGNIVAMTGDGVNDAPAVKAADIGVAMGKSGTDVTKEASSVIIMDDNFATIVAAVEEGRVIYRNIRSFIRYLLTCNLGEVLNMLFTLLTGAPVALLPTQILMVNLLTDGLPAIALGMEPPDAKEMCRPPRPKKEGLFARGLLENIVVRGVLLGTSTAGVFCWVLAQSGDITLARSACYLVLVLTQMVHLFECRDRGLDLRGNPYLIFASAASVALVLASVYLPVCQPIFGTCAVGTEWLIPVLLGTFAGPVLAGALRVVTRPFRRRVNQR